MLLFRPVGRDELRLIYEAGFRAFPPRLPDQPIFYPVLNEGYARQIASEWNTVSGSKAGFVTRFEVDDEFAGRYDHHVVGGREHVELWVPAEELAQFNRHIRATIAITAAFFGEGYLGLIPDGFALEGQDVRTQLRTLARMLDRRPGDLAAEIAANHVAVFINFPFWAQAGFQSEGIDDTRRDLVLFLAREFLRDLLAVDAKDEYFYGSASELIADVGVGSVTAIAAPYAADDYVWLGGPVAMVRGKLDEAGQRLSDAAAECGRIGEEVACAAYFPVTDHIGKPVVMLDASGLVTAAVDRPSGLKQDYGAAAGLRWTW